MVEQNPAQKKQALQILLNEDSDHEYSDTDQQLTTKDFKPQDDTSDFRTSLLKTVQDALSYF